MKIKLSIAVLITALLFGSCIKDEVKIFQGSVVEIDGAVLNGPLAKFNHPVLTRIPFAGLTSRTADSTLRRLNNTTISIRVNLVGPHSLKDETVGYTITNTPDSNRIAFPATSTATQIPPTGQTPSASAATLTLIPAVAGTHYNIASSGFITIPANSSFGFLDVVILNTAPTAATAAYLAIELTETGTLKPSANYKKIGLAIDQR